MPEIVRFLVESPVTRMEKHPSVELMLPLKQINSLSEVICESLYQPLAPLALPSTVPVATLVPSMIIRTDCLRQRRDFDPHTS